MDGQGETAGMRRDRPSGAPAPVLAMRILPPFTALLVLAGSAVAQQFPGDKKYGEYYDEKKQWSEQEVAFPAFPQPADLIEFDAGAASRNRHYVDAATLTVGGDRVVRYVVVIKTPGGATNISFEGLRCEARLGRHYGFGRADGSWAKARQSDWKALRPDSYQSVLSKEYFCPGQTPIFKAEEGVDALRRGGHPLARGVE